MNNIFNSFSMRTHWMCSNQIITCKAYNTKLDHLKSEINVLLLNPQLWSSLLTFCHRTF